MTRRGSLLLLALLAAVASSPPQPAGAAQVLATSANGFVAGPVRAADGRLVVGERLADGAIRALAVDPLGARAPQTLATFPAVAQTAARYTTLTLSGSGGVVAASYAQREVHDPHAGTADIVLTRARSLLPSAPLASCTARSRFIDEIGVAAGAGFVATTGEDCSSIARQVVVHGAGAARVVPAGAGAQITLVRAAGPYLGWAEIAPADPAFVNFTHAVVLARADTGAVLLRAPVGGLGADDLTVGEDGSLVWARRTAIPGAPGCGVTLYAASLAEPAPRALTDPATPCPSVLSSGELASTAGRVVYAWGAGWAVTGGATPAHAIAELPASTSATVAFDGQRAYATSAACDADRLLAVDVDAAGPAPAPPRLPYDQSPCPVTRTSASGVRLGVSRRVGLTLSCPRGCRGTIRLVQEHRGKERLAGSTPVAGQGALAARVVVARYAAALAGCGNGLRLRATLDQRLGSSGAGVVVRQSLGLLRARSAGACRRIAAPPFATPLSPR